MSACSTPTARALAGAVALGFFCSSADAAAYVRTTTPSGTAAAWPHMPIHYWLDVHGSKDLDVAAAQDAVRGALHAWESDCSDVGFVEDGFVDGLIQASDGKNVITWVEKSWCVPGVFCRDGAIGLSSVEVRAKDGLIVGADIEMNGAAHKFSLEPRLGHADVRAVILHEAGHMLGLGHVQSGPSVMVEGMAFGVGARTELSDDDRAFACEVYPRGATTPALDAGEAATPAATPPVKDGCALATAPPDTPFPALLVVAVLGAARRLGRSERRR